MPLQTKMIDIGLLEKNPDNPRLIKNEKFKKLVQSIKEFPEMLQLRPIVTDVNGMILGGNMRWEACKALDWKKVPVLCADDLTEEQKEEFIIKDNVSSGEYDWNMLANKWDTDLLTKWDVEKVGGYSSTAKTREKRTKIVTCPKCKHEFDLSKKEDNE